jgi:hypothetical protein
MREEYDGSILVTLVDFILMVALRLLTIKMTWLRFNIDNMFFSSRN